jgi:hypothetical protein
MELRKFISTTVRKYLNERMLIESESYPFNLNIKEKNDNGFKYNIFYYQFKIEDIKYECVIYPNAWKIRGKDFDVDFITKGGTTKDIVGKDLNFMNSVLKTIAECIIDFINKNDVVKKIRFQTQGVREKAYIRFFKSHPYFSDYEIDNSYEYSGFVEIHVNKGVGELRN